MGIIKSLISDIKPDSWLTFYLFYFNQGMGSDASFQRDEVQAHIFIGNLMNPENNGLILDAIEKKHELASGEFFHVLSQLSDADIEVLKTSAGLALVMDTQDGNAKSKVLKTNKDVKDFADKLRLLLGFKQLH